MTNPAAPSAATAHIRALRALPEMGVYEMNGLVWTRFKSMGEYKVSPHAAAEDDYDTDAWYVTNEDLAETVIEIVG